MRILYYFMNENNMMFQWQKYHIFDELETHGILFDIVSPLDYKDIESANDALTKFVRRNRYDMFMTSFNEEFLSYHSLDVIKSFGIPTVLFCPDNLVVPFKHKNIASKFDLVWLTSKETEYLFNRWRAKTIYAPYAANPNFLFPSRRAQSETLRIGFIGTPHGSRVDRINYLLQNGIPVTVHSKAIDTSDHFFKAKPSEYFQKFICKLRYPIGQKLAYAALIDKLWHRSVNDPYNLLVVKDSVPLNQLSDVNGQYALVLSFTDAESSGVLKNPVPIINLRNFEVPMSGGIQFTTYTGEMAEYFEDGKEIVLCHSKEEYIEKAKFYLRSDNDEVRKKIRVAARLRAEKDHTWFRRFQSIFRELNLHCE